LESDAVSPSHSAYAPLFKPLKIGNVTPKNRLAMAPMMCSFAEGGIHDPRASDYYGRRAAGGIGIIISEGTPPPHPVAAAFPRLPQLEIEPSWRRGGISPVP
jgi:2,4-dienoyl-CoA reductase-like NADH-dependent reductase (Old Yellow Enzyme family)